ncbi:hypothetical protein llap_11745 [Limosa lapponica baueri]|uniref:Uncharacterized protein n=1 Tax=Limosa lapponica baueri TaxID=1758121 RepID=A0A2I0TVU7_LIMLA|nr:hypothetical protein llap_11745 [Limosa lapponica baueri]
MVQPSVVEMGRADPMPSARISHEKLRHQWTLSFRSSAIICRLIKARKPRETHRQVNLDSAYKRYKTPCWFPLRMALHTYCNASNQVGMIIFAPVPLRCPTSYRSNGCQALLDVMMELEAKADTGGTYVEGIRLENKALFCHFMPLKSPTPCRQNDTAPVMTRLLGETLGDGKPLSNLFLLESKPRSTSPCLGSDGKRD